MSDGNAPSTRPRWTLRARLTLVFTGTLLAMLALFSISVAAILSAEEADDREEVAHGVAETSAVDANVRRVLIALGIALPGTIALAVGGAYFLARRALRPLDDIAEIAAAVHARDLDRRVPVQGGAEVERLARTLNELFERLGAQVAEVGRFTSDAAHELRTPLTAAAGTLEVALRQPDEEAVREAAGSALEELDRVRELLDALLLLARGDAGALAERREPIDVVAIARDVAATYAPVAEERRVALRFDEPRCAAAVRGDPTLLSRALANLVANAIEYAVSEVVLRVEVAGPEVRLLVDDDGPGVTDDDRPHLFTRFWRADAARIRRPHGGFGLGLALVAAIAQAHGGGATYSRRSPRGSRFTVAMPACD